MSPLCLNTNIFFSLQEVTTINSLKYMCVLSLVISKSFQLITFSFVRNHITCLQQSVSSPILILLTLHIKMSKVKKIGTVFISTLKFVTFTYSCILICFFSNFYCLGQIDNIIYENINVQTICMRIHCICIKIVLNMAYLA